MAELADVQTVSIRFDALHVSEGALTLNFAVYPTSAGFGQIKGSGSISRSLSPPEPPVHIHQVMGMYQTGPNGTLLVHVSGEYLQPVPPPGRGTFLGQFSASCSVDSGWNGRGSFIYGLWQVGPCVVTNIAPEAGDGPGSAVAAAT